MNRSRNINHELNIDANKPLLNTKEFVKNIPQLSDIRTCLKY